VASSDALLERAEVLDALAGLAAAASTGTGAAVAVIAPAGTGKTSVLAAAADGFRVAGLRVLTARASEQERHLPHGVTRTLLDPALFDASVRDSVLVDAAGPARVLFDGSSCPEAATLQHALYWTIAGLTKDGPLALVLDDAHAADEASLEFLAHLARRAADLPVLVVSAARPAEQAPWTAALSGLVDVSGRQRLEPLSLNAVTTLAANALGPDMPEDLADACLRSTGGNAFYLTELLADLSQRTAHLTADDVGSTAPPAIVRSVLMRIGALGDEAAELARAVAVLREPGRLRTASLLAGLDQDTAAGTADALTAAGVLAAEDGLRFAHPILRTAVLEDLGRHDRARRHRKAVDVLRREGAGAAVLATHLLETEPAGDQTTAAVLLEAGRDAIRSGSARAAVTLLRRALEEPPPEPERVDVLFELGRAEVDIGELVALEHLTASIEVADDANVRVERAVFFGELTRKIDLVPIGLDVLDGALASVSTDSELAIVAAMERYWAGRTTVPTFDRVRDGRRDLDRAYASEHPRARRIAAVYLAMEAAIADSPSSAWAEEAHASPGLLSEVDPDAGEVAAALFTLMITEDHATFEDVSRSVLHAAGRTGNWLAHALAALYRSTEFLRLGRYAEADAEVDDAFATAAEHGWPDGVPELVMVRALSQLARGDLSGAEATIASCAFDLEAPLATYPWATLVDARGQVRLAAGDPQGALDDFDRAGACNEAIGLHSAAALHWRAHRAAALRLLGEPEEAARAAADEVTWTSSAGPAARSAALRAVAANSPNETAISLLEEAASLVREDPSLVERAQVAAELGAALRRAGRVRDSRSPLATSLDLATRIGATPLAERIREELLAAGGRPRRTDRTGPGSLTASELRVVRLAASGMTNSVIAQSLFVSLKTVEKHLANAYAKLGIRSRAELVGLDLG
jgi:DNA-binding NarL/FixJ family response regulator